jgi:hypothetical protein
VPSAVTTSTAVVRSPPTKVAKPIIDTGTQFAHQSRWIALIAVIDLLLVCALVLRTRSDFRQQQAGSSDVDLLERGRWLAARMGRETAATLLGVLLIASVSVAAGFIPWTGHNRVTFTAVTVVSAVAVSLLATYAFCFILASAEQRDIARGRLREIKHASSVFRLDPIKADLVPLARYKDVLRLHVANRGRGGRFSALMEDIRGIDVPEFPDPFSYVYWMGEKDVFVEEIPRKENRRIGVVVITYTDYDEHGFPTACSISAMHPSGSPYDATYALYEGTTTVRVRVSARDDPVVAFSLCVDVPFTWKKGSAPVVGAPVVVTEEQHLEDTLDDLINSIKS